MPPPVNCGAYEAPKVQAPSEPALTEKDPAVWQLFAYGWQQVAESILGQRLETARCLHTLKQQGVVCRWPRAAGAGAAPDGRQGHLRGPGDAGVFPAMAQGARGMTYAIRCALSDLLHWLADRVDPEPVKAGGTD